jgi:hypothetical protein
MTDDEGVATGRISDDWKRGCRYGYEKGLADGRAQGKRMARSKSPVPRKSGRPRKSPFEKFLRRNKLDETLTPRQAVEAWRSIKLK